MPKKSMRIGYDISMQKGDTLKPTSIHYWQNEAKYKKIKAEKPFKYLADALLGLSILKSNTYLKSPLYNQEMQYSFVCEAWEKLDPHHHLFVRSNERILSLQSHLPMSSQNCINEFEGKFIEYFQQMQKPWGIDFSEFNLLVECINELESTLNTPIIFNLGIQFSKSFTNQLHVLYSLLFNLRSVIAVDYNAYTNDPSHEAILVDSLSDYLPRSEYVSNDALLYYHFKKLCENNKTSNKHESPIESLYFNPMHAAFEKYAHNACQLIDNLPKTFLNGMNTVELEEALYLVQMDWLLGSCAGLLFRIREEIFGLLDGYEKVFWSDRDISPKSHGKQLVIHTEFNHNDVEKQAA